MEFSTHAQDNPQEAVTGSKAVVSSLVLALKTLSLYPEDHIHCQAALARLQNDLETFFREREELTIDVKKDRLLFAGEVVHQGVSKEGELSFALFRDGIQNLVLRRGIDSREISELAKILITYKTITTEPEGDIVTALWEARLPHVQYEAADHVSEPDSEAGISSSEKNRGELPELPPGKELKASTPKEIHEYADASYETESEIKDLSGIDISSLQLTAEETMRLQEMVRREEEGDAAQDILNMMVDIANDQHSEEFLDLVLEYMEEELRTSLGRKNFAVSVQILRKLYQVRKVVKESGSWALSRVNKFLLRLSEWDFLASLQDAWPTVSALEIEEVKKVLLLWPSVAIGALGRMMLEAPSPSVRGMLSDVIVSLASRSLKPFETLLNTAEEDLVYHLVPLLGRMDDERSAKILVKMTHHPSERVRKEALRATMARGLWAPDALIFLMDDKSGSIRQFFANYLGSRRSEVAEGLLLNYLQNRRFRRRDREEVIACFKALGGCGTAGSLPFLEYSLLGGGWISRFCGSARRKGAAIALLGLGRGEAKKALEKASRSCYPGIRRAAQEAMQK